MNVIEWAQSTKADLVRLQREKGIPALWAAAQMCHESAVNGGTGLSDLAVNAHNYAGLKWAEWEREHGCEPVTYGTWEVLDGKPVSLKDAFCKAPSWEVWLHVYGDLLTGRYYGPALAYKDDPMLYGIHVWRLGWATDPNYLAAVSAWMSRLIDAGWQVGQEPHPPVNVELPDGTVLIGELRDNITWAPLRPPVEAVGGKVEWVPTPGGTPKVIVGAGHAAPREGETEKCSTSR